MAHFAKIGADNIVEDIVRVADEVILDENGVEQEQLGIDFLTNLTGHPNWKQASYNTIGGIYWERDEQGRATVPSSDQSKAFRKNYPILGGIYDATRNAFYEPQTYPSWSLNETSCVWEAPIPRPSDDSNETPYTWNEDAYQTDNTQGWELLTFDE
jgi:hypothetical protein